MKLTTSMRDSIVKKVTEATFAAQKAEIETAEHALVVETIDFVLTPSERKAFADLPDKFFGARNHYVCVKLDAENAPSSSYIQITAHKAKMPAHLGGTTVLVKGNLWDRIEAHKTARDAYNGDRKTFEAELKGVVGAFTSTDKLLEHMPSLLSVMGEAFFTPKEKPALPATIANRLEDRIAAVVAEA